MILKAKVKSKKAKSTADEEDKRRYFLLVNL
jgi:hypothetical protein